MDGVLIGKCSKTQGRNSRLDCTPQEKSNDDQWRCRNGEGEAVMTSERQRCVKNDAGSGHIAESCVCCVFVFLCVLCLSCLDAGRRRMSVILHGC